MNNIDPKLMHALDRGDGSVQAVVTLRSGSTGRPLEPAETKASVHDLIENAAKKTHSRPNDVVVFPNLQSFSIDADAKLIRQILAEDQVDSASLNSY